jgi:TolA-binding protein
LCLWWRDLPVLVVDQLEDGRVEAYVHCNRRMLSAEEAMHLSRQGPSVPKAQPRERQDGLNAMIGLVDQLEREQLNRQQLQAQRRAEKEARLQARPASRQKPSPSIEQKPAEPRPTAAAPQQAPLAASAPPDPPVAAPQQKPVRHRPAVRSTYRGDAAIRASLEAFWASNRSSVDSAHS